MTLFLHSLFLGYGIAVLAAIRLAEAGLALWAAVLVAWIGGNVLGLAFAMIGAALWPATPARRSSFTVTEAEFRLWDDDLARELIDADLRHDRAPVPAAPAAGQAPGQTGRQTAGQGARRAG